MNWTIRILKVAQSFVRGPEIFFMSRWNEFYPLMFPIVVLQNGERTILINTGPPHDLAALNASWLDYIEDPRGALVVRDEDRPEQALPAINIDPAQIDTIMLTPLQQYAIGGLRLFPNAQICINRHGWREFHGPRHPMSRALKSLTIPDATLSWLCTEAWDRVRLLEDHDEIAPGVITYRTGVHHPESTGVLVQTARGRVFLTDSLFYYENFEQNHLLGIAQNNEEFLDACVLIRKIADRFIPLYDPRVFDRHPDGIVA